MQKFILLTISLLVCSVSFSQKWKLTRYELMYGVGVCNYFGDIGSTTGQANWYGIKDIRIFGTRPSFMVGARYKIKQKLHTRAALSLIMLRGNDEDGTNTDRNYKFNTWGLEQTVQLEYALLSEDRRRTSFAVYNRRGMMYSRYKLGFYAFGGLGGLMYVPVINTSESSTEPKYNNKHDRFRDGFNYTGIVYAGVMVKAVYSNYLAMSLEFGPRYAFSDYLDGFTSTYSSFNDVYYNLNFSVIYRIKTSRKGYPMLFRRY